jgi:hypothetical protein
VLDKVSQVWAKKEEKRRDEKKRKGEMLSHFRSDLIQA